MAQAQLSGTLSNFITRIRRYLKETVPTKSHWNDNFLKQIFNSAYRRRCAQLFMQHEGYFTIIATRDLEAEQATYAWPTGFNQLLKLELVRADGRTVPIERFGRHQAPNHPPGRAGSEYFPSWRPIGSGFILEPAPLEAVTGGLRMEYHGTPEELTADGDNLHSDFPTIFDELLVLDAALTAIDQESVQEMSQSNNLLRLKMEWEQDWEQFISSRIINRQAITPFIVHYQDS